MRRILVIDDSEVINTLIRDYLQNHGYDVVTAESADAGYKVLKSQPVDLILLDIQLPDMGGIELCRHLRSQPDTRKIPIIMITATAIQTDDKVQGFQAGADDYLNKPFELNELLERVRAIFRRVPAERTFASAGSSMSVSEPLAESTVAPAPSLQDALAHLLWSPWDYPQTSVYPRSVLAFLLVLNGLLLLGRVMSPLSTVQPLMMVLLSLMYWGVLVSVCVVAGSFTGVTLSWGESARVISLAGVPVLLKLAAADVVSALTSLSPFYFTASPRLFWSSLPGWVGRLDLFELWAFVLLSVLLSRRPGSAQSRVWGLVGLLWLVSVGFWIVISRFGGVS